MDATELNVGAAAAAGEGWERAEDGIAAMGWKAEAWEDNAVTDDDALAVDAR